MRTVAMLIVLILAAVPDGAGQEVVVVRGREMDRSSAIARRAVRQFNDRTTTRVFGSLTIDADDAYDTDLGVADGRLRIFGEVNGDIVAINADVELRRGAVIRGDIVVLGGTLTRQGGVRLDGDTRLHRARVLADRDSDRLVLREGRTSRRRDTRRRRPRAGDVSIVFEPGGTYNRVEGLPVMGGANIKWNGFDRSTFSLEALAIVRTAGDLEDTREDLGYLISADIDVGDDTFIHLGGRVYDRVVPIEPWQFSAIETGWATLLWNRDYRDYFLSRGIAGFIELGNRNGVRLRGTLARNEEDNIAARDPWTPFGNPAWRPNALIDEGTFTSFRGEFTFDSRDNGRSRSAWYVNAEWERGVSDDVRPVLLPASIRTPIPTTDRYTFDRVFLDLRRYEPVGSGRLHLRVAGGGVVGDQPLPIQRRFSLGFPDPLPGFPFRSLNCGRGLADPAQTALCDRMVVFQAEYRGRLRFRPDRFRDWDDDDRRHHHRASTIDDLDWLWLDGPSFVVFADAGTAWLRADGPGDLEADVGAGLEFGSVGLYLARAVTGGDALSLSLRLQRRF